MGAIRLRWEARILQLLGMLLRVEERDNQWDRVIQISQRALEIDPLEEAFHRAAMKAFVRQDRHAAALAQFETCRDMLQEQLGKRGDPPWSGVGNSALDSPARTPLE